VVGIGCKIIYETGIVCRSNSILLIMIHKFLHLVIGMKNTGVLAVVAVIAERSNIPVKVIKWNVLGSNLPIAIGRPLLCQSRP